MFSDPVVEFAQLLSKPRRGLGLLESPGQAITILVVRARLAQDYFQLTTQRSKRLAQVMHQVVDRTTARVFRQPVTLAFRIRLHARASLPADSS